MKVFTALAFLMAIGGHAQSAGSTRTAVSKDGTRLAFDVTGTGPVLLLLHGGGQTRRVWHDAGYQPRLAGTRVSLALLEGLTHFQELERIDQALPPMFEFTRAHR